MESFVNRVIHGDCVTVMREMPAESVHLAVTDPPYLVSYAPRDGRRCLNDNEASWLVPSFREIYRVLRSDSFLATFYGWPWIDRFMAAWREAGFRPVSHLVWLKEYPSKEGYTRGRHEVGYLLAKGRPEKPAKPISDVLPWQYTGNRHHTNEKPLVAIRPLIEAYSSPGDIVLDPFAGSGTTAIAAQTCSRRFILIEKDAAAYRTACLRLARNRNDGFSQHRSLNAVRASGSESVQPEAARGRGWTAER